MKMIAIPLCAGVALVLDAEARRTVERERVRLDEGALVEQQVEALPGRELPAVVLARDRVRSTARERRLTTSAQLIEARYGLLGKLLMWRSRRAARRPGEPDRVGSADSPGPAGQVGIRVSVTP